MADAKFRNLAAIQARIARVAPAAAESLKRDLKVEVDGFVEGVGRAMDAIYETHDPDQQGLRDSLRAYPNPDREISYRVIADAKDEKGKFIGSNVEQGHKTVDGGQVAGRPAFWPTWRAYRTAMRRRLSKGARDATKAAFGE